MYQIGEFVLYVPMGVCRIAERCAMDFGAESGEYYVLNPIEHRDSVIYVPLRNERLLRKMRKLLSYEQAECFLEKISSADYLWIEEEFARKERYKQILEKAERDELIQIIKALLRHQQLLKAKGKKIHVSDEHFLKEAEKIICDELAFVLQIPAEQMQKRLIKHLQSGIETQSVTESERMKGVCC